MKVLIVSDSHGLNKELDIIINRHSNEVDAMIHCGDSERDADSQEMLNFITVRGNCDFDENYPLEQVKEIKNVSFYITHGHLYNVKLSLLNLKYRAEEVGASVVCFGHSHIAGAELIDGILFINPGSIRLPRLRNEKTYAIIEIDETLICTVHFYNSQDGSEINSLKGLFKIG
ncbi:metallophosphoesterase family protein [Bacillus sp. Marseille-P3661]|uniref:metallophosphoesterase family protein n=1 Tax=Bacillus sp. Marseille-P3661 TaxID=1936234 RepID=UPI000C861F76|nr:metallophosphoesterase [Bacillus sp. Marseille-P3661]